MRIVVCVKRVYDPKSIRISRSREQLDMRSAVKITSRPDRYALEAALRLREAVGGEIIALTLGDADAEDTAHEAVAIGADRAILLSGPELAATTGSGVTRAIAAAVERLMPVDLVLTGQVGMTDGTGSLAARLAAALEWPVALDAVRLEPMDGALAATVAWPDGGRLVPLTLPAVVASAPGPERPRYPHAARIANAWDEGLVEIWTAADLGLDAEALAPDVETSGLILGPERVRGQMIGGTTEEAAAALVEVLRTQRLI